MKNLHTIVAALAVSLLLALSAFAEDAKKETKKEPPKELKAQTLWPVLGGKIDSTAYTDIRGKRVYHCCPMCSKKMKADPDKYFKKAAEEGILFETIPTVVTEEIPKEFKQQTLCPVMGGKIDSTVYTDIQGQRVYHCCPMCSKKLKADPDQYFKKAAEEGILFENIQTVCPISGEAIDQSVSSYYEGRQIFFCCKNCRGTFAQDPVSYLSKMDQPADEKAAGKDEEHKGGHDHHGHDH